MLRRLFYALSSLAWCGSCFPVDSGIYAGDGLSTSPTRASQSEMTDMQNAVDKPQLSSIEEVFVRTTEASMLQDLAIGHLQSDEHVRRHSDEHVSVFISPSGEVLSQSGAARPPAAAPIPEVAGATRLHSSKPDGDLERNQRVVINARAEALPEVSVAALGEDSGLESGEDAGQSISNSMFVRRHDDFEEPLATAGDKAVLGSSAARPPAAAPISEDAGATWLDGSKPHGHLQRDQRFVINTTILPESSMATLGEDLPVDSDDGTNLSPSDSDKASSSLDRPDVLTWGLVTSSIVFVFLSLTLLFYYMFGGRSASEVTANVGGTNSLQKRAVSIKGHPSCGGSTVESPESSDGGSKESLKDTETLRRHGTIKEGVHRSGFLEFDMPRAPRACNQNDESGGGTGGIDDSFQINNKPTNAEHKRPKLNQMSRGSQIREVTSRLEVQRTRSEGMEGSTFHSEDFGDSRRATVERDPMLPIGLRKSMNTVRSTMSRVQTEPIERIVETVSSDEDEDTSF